MAACTRKEYCAGHRELMQAWEELPMVYWVHDDRLRRKWPMRKLDIPRRCRRRRSSPDDGAATALWLVGQAATAPKTRQRNAVGGVALTRTRDADTAARSTLECLPLVHTLWGHQPCGCAMVAVQADVEVGASTFDISSREAAVAFLQLETPGIAAGESPVRRGRVSATPLHRNCSTCVVRAPTGSPASAVQPDEHHPTA